MAKLKDLRVCKECGSVFSKHIEFKIILKCPNCGHVHREMIDANLDP